MKKSYTVASVNPTKVNTRAEINGVTQNVEVNGLEVELVAEDGMSSSITLRFIGADVEAAKAAYVLDESVTPSIG